MGRLQVSDQTVPNVAGRRESIATYLRIPARVRELGTQGACVSPSRTCPLRSLAYWTAQSLYDMLLAFMVIDWSLARGATA